MNAVRRGLNEGLTEIDLAVSTAKRSQFDLSSRLGELFINIVFSKNQCTDCTILGAHFKVPNRLTEL